MAQLSDTRVLVSGATSGLGRAMAQALAQAAAVDSAYEMLGGLDVLVNNAGIGMWTVNPRFMTEPQRFWEVPPAGFRDVLETGVWTVGASLGPTDSRLALKSDRK
jgi:NAD(P)-dependent dehydrogenase (short-subunit alcohol dehydrogenase family)